MKVPKQFTLSTLLLAMLVASLVFGFLAWRASNLRAEIASINKQGVTRVILSDSWLWPTPRQKATLVFRQDVDGNLYVADKPSASAAVAKSTMK